MRWGNIHKKTNKIIAGYLVLVLLVTLATPFMHYAIGATVNDGQGAIEEEDNPYPDIPNQEEVPIEDRIPHEIISKINEPEVLPTKELEEDLGVGTIKGRKSQINMMSVEEEPTYVMAKDTDFVFYENNASGYAVNGKKGYFMYVGKEPYIEIPHVIQGHKMTSYQGLFRNATNTLKGIKSTNPNIKSVQVMFQTATLESLDLREFDTSNMTNLGYMFGGARIKNVDLSTFDTRKVYSMERMFEDSDMETLDLSSFNTTGVSTMGSMFNASKATSIDLSSFVTRNVSNMGNMFTNSRAAKLDLSKFDTINVQSMGNMFAMSSAEEIDLTNFNTISVTNMSSMFRYARANKITLGKLNTDKVTTMEGMFEGVNVPSIDVSSFNTSKVTTMSRMFYGATIPSLDLRSFNTSKVTNMSTMFREFNGKSVDFSTFNTSNTTNMGQMFKGSGIDNIDLRVFDTRNVTNMVEMFQDSKASTINASSFRTSRVTDMKNMFSGAKANAIDVSGFDTSYVTDMGNMFQNTNIGTLDLSSFDLSSINNTGGMFRGSTIQKSIARSQSDADKLNNSGDKPAGVNFEPKYRIAKEEDFIGTINGSFKYIGKEEYVEVPHKIRNVNVTSYKNMFENTTVKGVISTNPNITDMSGMFKGNTSTQLEVGTIDTTSVTNMGGMFQNTKAENLDLRNFKTDKVVDVSNMFSNTKVNELDLGSFDLTKATNTSNLFSGTTSLTGYARTVEDVTKLNNSTNKPTGLTFTIWSITSEQTPKEWTNKTVDIHLKALSDKVGIDFVEMVNEPGRNLLTNSHREVGVGGKNEFIQYADIAPVIDKYGLDQTYTLSLDLKSADISKRDVIQVYMQNGSSSKYNLVATNVKVTKDYKRYTFEGLTAKIANAGDTKAMLAFYGTYGTGNFPIIKNVKVELGDKATPWTPAPEDSGSSGDQEDSFTVYDNGTYIFRATDLKGDTRTIAHTVNNIDKEAPTATVKKSTTGWTGQDVELTVTASDDKSGVKSIVLPDKTVENASTATYKASSNGDYVFKIIDNAGNETSVTEKVTNIDKTVPTLTTKVDNKNWTRDPVNITVTSEQSTSGLTDIIMKSSPLEGRNLLKRIKDLQTVRWDGWDYGLTYPSTISLEEYNIAYGDEVTLSFNVDATNKPVQSFLQFRDKVNKTYIQYEGNTIESGNAGTTTITTKVPSKTSLGGDSAPVARVSPTIRNKNNSNGGVATIRNPKFEIGKTATPYTPAPEDIPLINHSKTYPVVANGLYTFEATYNNGVTSEASVNITNIDREPPTITISGNPKEYTESGEVQLQLDVQDLKSGIKKITLPDNTVTTNPKAVYKVNANGTYTFTAEDNLGNKTTHTEVVDKIMVPYIFYMYDSKGKPLQGAVFELLRDGQVHATAESDAKGLVNFGKVPASGKYTIKQTKAPDGFVVNPDEKEVEVGDTTEPEEFISYPRGDTLPATGTIGFYSINLLGMGILATSIAVGVKIRRK